MTIGIVILAHENLDRTRQLARALVGRNVRVVVHVDQKTDNRAFRKLTNSFSKNPNIDFADRISCEWGGFSLVQAGLSSADHLLKKWPDVSHVVQISGSCLPLRPVGELLEFLARKPDCDFVESVPADTDWVKGGLSEERFKFFFPFSWQRQRLLFDVAVKAQRFLRINRRMPNGLVPHLGSQWWCLSKRTLKAILNDPEKPALDTYFAKCWIPDEGYVPTLVRKHAINLVAKSLTLSRFDDQGKPHVFYDDHARLLRQADQFFARKIWHGADLLYREFLHKRKAEDKPEIADVLGLGHVFADSYRRRCGGRPGKRNAGRFPSSAFEKQPSTCTQYGVVMGLSSVYDGLERHLTDTTGMCVHGRLFQKNRVSFANKATMFTGGIPDNPLIRDINPEQFLCNILWNAPGKRQSLSYEISDGPRMAAFLARDMNARLVVVKGSWILDLFNRGDMPPDVLRTRALRLQEEEKAFLGEIAETGRQDVLYVPFHDAVRQPEMTMAKIRKLFRPDIELGTIATPELRSFLGLDEFLDGLENLGVSIDGLGPIPPIRQGDAHVTRIRASA